MKNVEEKFKPNGDLKTISGFGDEWSRFDQADLSEEEGQKIFNSYFNIFPWESLPVGAVGFDLGCGSGRWASYVSPRVGLLHCIDPSDAIEVAKKNLSSAKNCKFHRASVDQIPLDECSMDFAYSLGVLHHVPDTLDGLRACVAKLKPGAPLLLYLYYSFENRPWWFILAWRVSNIARLVISKLPHEMRYIASQLIAIFVYYPLAKISRVIDHVGFNVSNFPLSAYRNLSFYTMRTDALDRFGTRLEKRFSKSEIQNMMNLAGLEGVIFSSSEPFWCALGYKIK